MGNEVIPDIIDRPPRYPLELTYKTVRTFPGKFYATLLSPSYTVTVGRYAANGGHDAVQADAEVAGPARQSLHHRPQQPRYQLQAQQDAVRVLALVRRKHSRRLGR